MAHTGNGNKATNWDEYYAKPASATQFTRKISERKILKLLGSYSNVESPEVAELGGANSCFVDAILRDLNPRAYVAIDNNHYGLSLLEDRYSESNVVQGKFADALELSSIEEVYDCVFSVGLIEHFGKEGTSACIKSHFDLCKTGGVVLITFPTQTFLYSAIRGLAEMSDNWQFHDERPLAFQEVEATAGGLGELLHRSTNWAIGLTQGYLVYRKD